MKKHSTIQFSQVTQSHLNELTTIVSETLAYSALPAERRFTSAELWSIQRQARKRVQRRFAL